MNKKHKIYSIALILVGGIVSFSYFITREKLTHDLVPSGFPSAVSDVNYQLWSSKVGVSFSFHGADEDIKNFFALNGWDFVTIDQIPPEQIRNILYCFGSDFEIDLKGLVFVKSRHGDLYYSFVTIGSPRRVIMIVIRV